MKRVFAAAAVFLCASPAMAGQACPGVDIHYVGSPDWLSNNQILDNLTSQQTWVGINSREHPEGRILTRIAPGSAAARAGLLKDDILLSINGGTDLSFNDIAAGQEVRLLVKRDGNSIPITLTMGRADPVHFALADAFDPDVNGCPYATLSNATPIMRDVIMKNALTADRAFRCDDAHDVLAFMGQDYEINEAYLIRGSRRLLLTIPHFGTACIESTALDGDALTQAASLAFLMQAAESFIQYQEDNP